MSSIDCYENVKKYLEKLQACVGDSNYSGAAELSANLTRFSIVLDWDEGVNISEFFEWLFLNLRDVYADFEIEDEDLREVNEKISRLIIVFDITNLTKIQELSYPLFCKAHSLS